jgi:hypothetical protein
VVGKGKVKVYPDSGGWVGFLGGVLVGGWIELFSVSDS